MSTGFKTTPLYTWHKSVGANMADFGGYQMPLWYETGVKKEHLSVLLSAGIFDTSHMACIKITGTNAFDLLNYCFTRDISNLLTGRCVYGAFLDNAGHCIDDAIVYKFSDESFMVCVNAGMGPAVAGHLSAQDADDTVVIEDLTDQVAKMDIQGKNSARILSELIKDPETVLNAMPYFSFKGGIFGQQLEHAPVTLLDGTPILLSRSGYTGEFGFEIFIEPEAIVSLWQNLLTAGEQFNLMACGLGARDSLRAGACLPLSHQDIGGWPFIHHPWDFALPFSEGKKGFTKTFLGAEALLNASHDLHTYPFAGDSLRKVAAGKDTIVKNSNGDAIGHVLTCVTDMGITWHENRIVSIGSKNMNPGIKIKGISCGFVQVKEALTPGSRISLLEGKRSIDATIVSDIRPDRTARKKLDNFV